MQRRWRGSWRIDVSDKRAEALADQRPFAGLTVGEARVVRSVESLVHDFRKLVFAGVAKALAQDGHCKSYEGTVELHTCWPNYFEANGQENWGMTAAFGGSSDPHGMHYKLVLHCYVLGPGRHYKWEGGDIEDVFERAVADVSQWVAELDEG